VEFRSCGTRARYSHLVLEKIFNKRIKGIMANGFLSPGYGSIKAGNKPPAICGDVPKFVACAPIIACPDGSVLWQPVPGAATATVSIENSQNNPEVWIAYKLIGAATPRPCACKGSITFNIPPGASLIMFTVYFTTKPATTAVSITWNANEIQPHCP
jgi:hypothetical protein